MEEKSWEEACNLVEKGIAGELDTGSKAIAERYERIGDTVGKGAEDLANTDTQSADIIRESGTEPASDTGGVPNPAQQDILSQEQPDAALVVADEVERILLSGVRARWANFDEAEMPYRKFEAWMRSPTEGPLPPLSPDSGLNCWEMLLWAGARKNVITHAELNRMYTPIAEYRRGGKFPSDSLIGDLLPHGKARYTPGDPAGPHPQRGDVIIWSGNGAPRHVVMATGRTAADGSAEVYSFWPPPKDELTMDPDTGSWGTVTDAVQLSTINELTPHLQKPGEPDPVILYGRGPW